MSTFLKPASMAFSVSNLTSHIRAYSKSLAIGVSSSYASNQENDKKELIRLWLPALKTWQWQLPLSRLLVKVGWCISISFLLCFLLPFFFFFLFWMFDNVLQGFLNSFLVCVGKGSFRLYQSISFQVVLLIIHLSESLIFTTWCQSWMICCLSTSLYSFYLQDN